MTVAGMSTPELEPGLVQRIFRHHAAGVAVITTGGSAPVGFTATSLVSVAATPPLVSFNISHGSSSWPAMRSTDYVGMHLLAADQQRVATVFATRGIDRFDSVRSWRRGPYGLPVLDGVLAFMAARIHSRFAAGDHSVVVAEIVQATCHPHAAPLLYHGGSYRRISEELA